MNESDSTPQTSPTLQPAPGVLILTPIKDAVRDAQGYFERLQSLTYPADRISVGLLEGDSRDNTFDVFSALCRQHSSHFRKISIWQKNFGFHLPHGVPRWESKVQFARRSVLAKSRNHLLFRALDDEDWVLWLDVDVIEFPKDIIERLLSYGKDILQPHCVKRYGGNSYDLNAWRDHGKIAMHHMRGEGELAKLDSVGGTMLLVRADCHRDGLVFPSFLYGARNPLVRTREDIFMPEREGELETEGFGIMASDMNLECWGLPNLEIIHANR